MCGIAGFVNIRESSGGQAALERMTTRIAHRGPDGHGWLSDGTAFLGHRRLSIIDVEGGVQPMCTDDGRVWLTYNGEVFNHADLRPDLERAGYQYRTRSDTETILHAYEEYGANCVTRFRGMFAFAIWDQRTGELFCARDRLGIKPFYYYWDGRLFAFASEIKALFEHPAISTALEESELVEYLAFGYGSTDCTLFRGIRKLMPGHTLRLAVREENPQPRVTEYWDVPAAEGSPGDRSDAEWIKECRARLEETVRMRLMSDVPLGMFLSGGVDSSAIAALMTRMAPGPVKTFAVGYPETAFSELQYARQVATLLRTDHHEVIIGMDDFFQALPNLVWHEDEPIAWPSSVSLHAVSKLASQEVKVVLTGEGSDELFGGYARYNFYLRNLQALKFYGLLPAAIRRRARGMVSNSPLLSASLRRKIGHTFVGRSEDIESLYLDNFYCAWSQDDLARMDAPAGDPYSSYLHFFNARPHEALLSRLLYADQKTYLVELLMKQDQMSMATSIESRVPFLDHPLVEFATRVPAHLKIRNGTGKYILKQALADLLPPEIIHRKKMGFPTPLTAWLRDRRAAPLMDMIRDRDGLLASFLDLKRVDDLIQRHQSGFEDGTDRLWRLLNFQIWGDLFLLDRQERWDDALSAQPLA
jgi:asparagine synthase (glutamine-hydrolysing)